MRGLLPGLTCCLLWGCQSEVPQPIPSRGALNPSAGLPAHYQFLHEISLNPDKIEDLGKSLPYTHIELERTACLGMCPAYTVRFHADGTAEYSGREFSTRPGNFRGEVDIGSYGRLCWMIDKFNLRSGPRRFVVSVTDAPSTYVRLTLRGSAETLEFYDVAAQGPIELWALQNSLEAIAQTIDWQPAIP